MRDYEKRLAKAAGIRAIKTAAQAAIAIIGVSNTMGGVDWPLALSSALVAAILSLLTSVSGLPEVDTSVEKKAE